MPRYLLISWSHRSQGSLKKVCSASSSKVTGSWIVFPTNSF
jgi:hypothetical protein